jgi:hypothetical protein
MDDLERHHRHLMIANEHLRLARIRIDVLTAAIARADRNKLPTVQAMQTLELLHESIEVMLLYQAHASANYETALLMSRL